MKSSVFTKAWELFKASLYRTFGEALSAAWKMVKLVLALVANTCINFTFRKLDGSIRKAKGTMDKGVIANNTATNSAKRKSTKKKVAKPSVIKYFDVEKKGFRSFNIYQLIEVTV